MVLGRRMSFIKFAMFANNKHSETILAEFGLPKNASLNFKLLC